MSGFSFLTRLATGHNGSKSINSLIDSLVSAINTALGSGAVSTAQLADSSVTTIKLADGSVTEIKIGAGAVTVNKIGAGAVTTAKIGAAAVTGAKLDADATTSWIVAGSDASSAAQDLTATGAVTGLRIVEVIDLTTPAVVDKSTISAGADKFVQASGNLSSKSLLIRTLPASA